jgi:hypothetical protein
MNVTLMYINYIKAFYHLTLQIWNTKSSDNAQYLEYGLRPGSLYLGNVDWSIVIIQNKHQTHCHSVVNFVFNDLMWNVCVFVCLMVLNATFNNISVI